MLALLGPNRGPPLNADAGLELKAQREQRGAPEVGSQHVAAIERFDLKSRYPVEAQIHEQLFPLRPAQAQDLGCWLDHAVEPTVRAFRLELKTGL